MKVQYHTSFIKHFKKRFGENNTFKSRYKERLLLFIANSQDSVLRDHALQGKKLGLRAFSITGDIRVIYFIHNDIAYFFDIGTHNQVY